MPPRKPVAKAGAARQPRGFAAAVIDWQRTHGRHDLPWQNTRDAYRIWLSEIMLQQTQVATVLPYYARFLARFPTLESLAAAPVEDVMPLWAGLGYYARARNLHACARAVVARHGGAFPQDAALIAELPGIGRSTAAAIAAFAFGARGAILDGNVKRVLTRCFGIEGFPGEKKVENRLWELAESLLPERDIEIYTQGIMDLGATLCARGKPRCEDCPLAAQCVARAEDRVAELPTARPRKAPPHKRARYLLLRHAGRVLLEQRPPQGIWGGLLCLPELAENEDAILAAKQRYGCTIDSPLTLPDLKHAFTHFTLTLEPLEARVRRIVPHAAQGNLVWLEEHALIDAALPTPIRKLLMPKETY